MYITEKAVNKTLSVASYNSGPGSSTARDCIYKPVTKGECSFFGADKQHTVN